MRIETRLNKLEAATENLPFDPDLFGQRLARASKPQKEILLRELSDENLETLCELIHRENPELATMTDEELEAIIAQEYVAGL